MAPQKRLVSQKALELVLQDLETFSNPKPELEQYPLTPRAASFLLSTISNTFNDIENKIICDLGCGTGIIAIGAALLGAKEVIGVDIDTHQLEIAVKNAQKLQLIDKIRWINMDIQNFSIPSDIIIQNPPFGVQKRDRGMDTVFLEKAIENAKIIYSIHKSGDKTQRFLRDFIEKHDAFIDAIIPIQITISHLFPFHKKKAYPVNVDFYRIISSKKI